MIASTATDVLPAARIQGRLSPHSNSEWTFSQWTSGAAAAAAMAARSQGNNESLRRATARVQIRPSVPFGPAQQHGQPFLKLISGWLFTGPLFDGQLASHLGCDGWWFEELGSPCMVACKPDTIKGNVTNKSSIIDIRNGLK